MTPSKMSKTRARKTASSRSSVIHPATLQRLAEMSSEEIFQSLVRVGIYTKKGKLRKPYAPDPSDPK